MYCESDSRRRTERARPRDSVGASEFRDSEQPETNVKINAPPNVTLSRATIFIETQLAGVSLRVLPLGLMRIAHSVRPASSTYRTFCSNDAAVNGLLRKATCASSTP
jgi:hypothetical protein